MIVVMRNTMLTVLIGTAIAMLPSCANKSTTAGSGPHATLQLRDGTTFSGAVSASSPQQITVAGDNNGPTRTFEMKDVKSVDYGEQTAAATAPSAPLATGTPPSDAAQQQAAEAATEQHEQQHAHPEESAIRTKTYVLRPGTHIAVRTEETIDSGRAVEGQTYPAEIAHDVFDAEGQVVIPRGANAVIVIRSASKGGHFRGRSDLVLDLDSVAIAGRSYALSTEDIVQEGKEGLGKNKRTAEYTGGGAIVGSIIGAIAGHGKGAIIGGASGAAAGAAGQLITRGGSIKVPVESLLTFQLDRPLRVTARH